MANDTKVAALLRPATHKLHKHLGQAVIDVIQCNQHTRWTRQRLAERLGKPINCVTAPIKELLDSGILVEHERVTDTLTGCKRWTLKLKEHNDSA